MDEDSLVELWDRLKSVERFTFEARSGEGSLTGWNGVATGSVDVLCQIPGTIIYKEICQFVPENGETMQLKNTYEWQQMNGMIRLSHARRVDRQHLVDIREIEEGCFTGEPHLCGKDYYHLRVKLLEEKIEVLWSIEGPRKNERICYVYQ